MSLTGHKDTENILLKKLDDESLLNILMLNRYYLEKGQEFFKRRLEQKFPTLVKWKTDDEQSWSQYYLSIVYYLAKLKEEFDLILDPFLFKGYKDQPKRIYKKLNKLRNRNPFSEIPYYIKQKVYQAKFSEVVDLLDRIEYIEAALCALIESGQIELFIRIWKRKSSFIELNLEMETYQEIYDENKLIRSIIINDDPQIITSLFDMIVVENYPDKIIRMTIQEGNRNLISAIKNYFESE